MERKCVILLQGTQTHENNHRRLKMTINNRKTFSNFSFVEFLILKIVDEEHVNYIFNLKQSIQYFWFKVLIQVASQNHILLSILIFSNVGISVKFNQLPECQSHKTHSRLSRW
jgi:hypothetical protein